MIYKAATNLRGRSTELEEDLPAPEMLGEIPTVEWEQEWWKRKLRCNVCSEIMDQFREDNEEMMR